MSFKKNMLKFVLPNLVFIALMFSSCGKSLPKLEGVDLTGWKNDKNACSGKREEMLKSIDAEKAKLISLSEMDILALLGKPDQNELYKRNQKFYTYFVQASAACDSGNMEHPRRLVIRFNAMGLAKEVSVDN